jgi:hypothetical protein
VLLWFPHLDCLWYLQSPSFPFVYFTICLTCSHGSHPNSPLSLILRPFLSSVPQLTIGRSPSLLNQIRLLDVAARTMFELRDLSQSWCTFFVQCFLVYSVHAAKQTTLMVRKASSYRCMYLLTQVGIPKRINRT